jgi:molybdopterin converting factor small subunit
MNVRVKLFAVAKQRVGRPEIEVALPAEPAGCTVRQLRGAIVEQHPALADVVAHARLAVGNEYAEDDAEIGPAAEIAIIPPVSGG